MRLGRYMAVIQLQHLHTLLTRTLVPAADAACLPAVNKPGYFSQSLVLWLWELPAPAAASPQATPGSQ